ncbi:MAG: hypothetical protein FWG12_01380 [Holophagaceae bacterium]|nr:hypothetical protein [Holophagaceae bacterium]
MVSPLGQRMVFQTAHTEAARAAHEVATQLQREDNFKKLLADRMAEDSNSVRSIERSEALRAEERQERQRQRRSGGQSGEEENDDGNGDQEKEASFADGSLDFLA